MTKKIVIGLLTTFSVIAGSFAYVEQTKSIPRIGFVSVSGDAQNPGRLIEAFRQGLRDSGYSEGKNIIVDYRYPGEGANRAPDLVLELLQLKVDVLVSSSAAALRSAKQLTSTIPIVMIASFDPVESAMVDSFAHPGGNITGVTRLSQELSGKRLELFKESVPKLSRVGILAAQGNTAFRDYLAPARAMAIPIESLEMRGSKPDLGALFQAAAKARVNGIITAGSSAINRYRDQIVELALKHRMPSMFAVKAWVESGGLMSYSTDDLATFRRAAQYVDRILKGTRPADLPIEQPTKFEFVVNLKTAKTLNLTIPQSVLFRADRVIR
jgi:ABC-type uncharacterized transport system substrate-binding protein